MLHGVDLAKQWLLNLIKLQRELSSKGVKFAKINVDANGTWVETRTELTSGILSIPALVFFKNGKEVNRLIGGQDAKTLKAKITQVFGL